jgi:hypothetical protein
MATAGVLHRSPAGLYVSGIFSLSQPTPAGGYGITLTNTAGEVLGLTVRQCVTGVATCAGMTGMVVQFTEESAGVSSLVPGGVSDVALTPTQLSNPDIILILQKIAGIDSILPMFAVGQGTTTMNFIANPPVVTSLSSMNSFVTGGDIQAGFMAFDDPPAPAPEPSSIGVGIALGMLGLTRLRRGT